MVEQTVLNMPGLWICMLILYVRQAFEDASSSNKPGFWIWHGCICKGYAEFRICLIMAPCISIMPEYALMFLNIPEYDWILMSLNMSEHSWLNCSDYARVLNMPRYSYNNIITVTNVIILEFLSTRFVHPGSLLPFYLF